MTRSPSFKLSLALIIGAFAALYNPIALLFLAFLYDKHFLKTVLLALASAVMIWCRVELPSDEFHSEGAFKISSISEMDHHWFYRGYWYPNGKAIPATIVLDDDGTRPAANRDWWVEGDLKIGDAGRYRLKVDPYQPWIALPYSSSWEELRFAAKQRVGDWIDLHIKNRATSSFLTGIATGSFDDREMTHQFSRFGLQHIMAISGFHFALVAGFIAWCIRPFFAHATCCAILLFLLTAYCIFLGSAPSVMRAWMTLCIVLIGQLSQRNITGLNALGLTMTALIIWDPLLLHTIGFCFSCASTAAILLFYQPAERLIETILPKRVLKESTQLTFIDQHGYCLASLVRGMLALTLAVNIVAIPITLFYFQYFPLMSVIYNLFFPLLVTVSMILLLLSIPMPFLHPVNEFWTQHMLTFTSNMPTVVDIGIRSEWISGWVLGIFLGVFVYIALQLKVARSS